MPPQNQRFLQVFKKSLEVLRTYVIAWKCLISIQQTYVFMCFWSRATNKVSDILNKDRGWWSESFPTMVRHGSIAIPLMKFRLSAATFAEINSREPFSKPNHSIITYTVCTAARNRLQVSPLDVASPNSHQGTNMFMTHALMWICKACKTRIKMACRQCPRWERKSSNGR